MQLENGKHKVCIRSKDLRRKAVGEAAALAAAPAPLEPAAVPMPAALPLSNSFWSSLSASADAGGLPELPPPTIKAGDVSAAALAMAAAAALTDPDPAAPARVTQSLSGDSVWNPASLQGLATELGLGGEGEGDGEGEGEGEGDGEGEGEGKGLPALLVLCVLELRVAPIRVGLRAVLQG